MDIIKLTQDQKQLIEKVGVFYEQSGLQPAPSRVIALLLVSDKTELTFDQIGSTLKISKSATSNAINLLLTTGKIDYITLSGDRKRYFRSRVSNWKEETRKNLNAMLGFNNLLKEVLNQRPKSTKDFNANLAEVIQFMEFIHAEVDTIFQKWESKQKKNQKQLANS